MRIGIFTDTYPPFINGVSTSVTMLENALRKLGHEVFIICVNPKGFQYKLENNNTVLRIPGIPTGTYDYRLTPIYPFRAVKKIKQMKLDVIHSQTEFGIGTFARIISKKLNIPIVHTYHTMYEDYLHSVKKGPFDLSKSRLLKRFTNFYCDKTINELIVPTKKTYDLFKKKYQYERDVFIVPTGLEIERFNPKNIDKKVLNEVKEKLNISRNDKIIMYLGRLGSEKSIDLLLQAHKKIVKNNLNVKLLFVGDGPEKENIEKYAQDNNLNSSIFFAGKVPYDMVPYYYALCDIFTTASLFETQGLTVIEAMASGKVVVVRNDEAFNKIVIDKENGLLFDDEKEYIKKVELVLNNNDLSKKLYLNALNDSQKYSSETFAQSIIKVYEKAIKNGRKKNKKNNI